MYELAAVGAAACWALTGIISVWPAGQLGAPAFNRLRQLFVTGLLAVYVLATGAWQQLGAEALVALLVSGMVGIFIGDTLLFATLNRLGPRRSGILFALTRRSRPFWAFWYSARRCRRRRRAVSRL